MRGIRLGTFSPSVLLEVARASGVLAAEGLEVVEVPATSSPQQFTDLFGGRLDAALTNPDNVVAYRCVPENPLGRTGDVRILAGVDRGLGLSLFLGPSMTGIDDIRRGVVGVDVRGSGFAFVCFELLARAGLRIDVDYTVEALGATPRRLEALLAGRCAATVLNAGNELLAERDGARWIASVTQIGPYPGAVLAATGASLARNGEPLRDLVRVMAEAGRMIHRPDSVDLVLAAIERRLGMTGPLAHAHRQVLTGSATGLVLEGRVPVAELETVFTLRRRHAAGAVPELADALRAGLVDESLLG